jgi:hypothetical protein
MRPSLPLGERVKKEALSLLKQKMRNMPHHVIRKGIPHSETGYGADPKILKRFQNLLEVSIVPIVRRGICR